VLQSLVQPDVLDPKKKTFVHDYFLFINSMKRALSKKLLGFVLRFKMQNTNPHDDGEAEAKACMSCTEYNASNRRRVIFGVNGRHLRKDG
jgi:hypothetical protein